MANLDKNITPIEENIESNYRTPDKDYFERFGDPEYCPPTKMLMVEMDPRNLSRGPFHFWEFSTHGTHVGAISTGLVLDEASRSDIQKFSSASFIGTTYRPISDAEIDKVGDEIGSDNTPIFSHLVRGRNQRGTPK